MNNISIKKDSNEKDMEEIYCNKDVGMCIFSDNLLSIERVELIGDIFEHIKYYIFLNKTIDEKGNIHRFVDEISTVINNELKLIYKKGEKDNENRIRNWFN